MACASISPSSRNTATAHVTDAVFTGKMSVDTFLASSASLVVKNSVSEARCMSRSLRYTCAKLSWHGVISARMRSLRAQSLRLNSRCTQAGLPSRPARPDIWLNSISLNGMWYSTTWRMFGISTPSPNALVAMSTRSASVRNSCSMRLRSLRDRPAL